MKGIIWEILLKELANVACRASKCLVIMDGKLQIELIERSIKATCLVHLSTTMIESLSSDFSKIERSLFDKSHGPVLWEVEFANSERRPVASEPSAGTGILTPTDLALRGQVSELHHDIPEPGVVVKKINWRLLRLVHTSRLLFISESFIPVPTFYVCTINYPEGDAVRHGQPKPGNP